MTVRFVGVEGWPGYRVGDDGSVWTCRTNHGKVGTRWRRLKTYQDKDGYPLVGLSNRGVRKTRRLGHLVLEAFVGKRPDGHEMRHFPDPDPANNTLSNLSWSPHTTNIADKTVMGTVARGEAHGMVKLTADSVTELRELRRQGWTYRALGDRFGIALQHARLICLGRYWRTA